MSLSKNDAMAMLMSNHNYVAYSFFKVLLPLLFLISGCTAHYPVNESIDEIDRTGGYRPQLTQNESRSDT